MSKKRGLVALVIGLAGVASGCGQGGGTTAAPQGTASAKGGVLHVLASIDLEHLDPARNYVTSSMDVGRLIYRTLTTNAAAPGPAGGEIVPDLATDLGTPTDGARTWTFTLKEGVKFEDGRPITSKDVKYGVERTFAPEFPEGPPYARMWLRGGDTYKGPLAGEDLKAIETPDDRTIVFRLNRPVADFGSAVSMPFFSPVPKDKEAGVAYDNRPFSSGPYKIEKFEPKKRIELVRNEHWNRATDTVRKGLPDRVVIDLNLDPAVIDQRMIAGQGEDANAVQFEPIGAASVAQVLTNPALKERLVTGESINTRFLSLNTSRKPLDQVKVRQAIAYALDKEALRTVRGGPIAGDIATTLLPPAIPGHRKEDPYPVDVAKAKALLAEAGFASGIDLTLDTPATPSGKAQGEAIQASLGRAGIRVKINEISSSAFWSTVGNTSQQHDLVIDGWTPDWTGASTYLPNILDGRFIVKQGNQNRARYDSAEVNKRFDEIAAMTDAAAAATAYGELATRIMKDAPVVPFLWDKSAFLTGSNVTGAYGHVAFVGRVDLATVGLKSAR
ncbi:ABC transporter substrate-binding protein [Nonomuraea africana]|uniref:Peptide/nickel transport system substrate-binding protein n=1 Tax=Nonomuraea africana TaxID=46171 RepID=A0ABR9KAY5_9ACTN|nr:ABC transporter substrate-binding protein [Nonomuraea africana]MBE1559177.1 peptide/nickel transport system substrate-binding protein [Nonomuraea africana]